MGRKVLKDLVGPDEIRALGCDRQDDAIAGRISNVGDGGRSCLRLRDHVVGHVDANGLFEPFGERLREAADAAPDVDRRLVSAIEAKSLEHRVDQLPGTLLT